MKIPVHYMNDGAGNCTKSRAVFVHGAAPGVRHSL